MKGELTMRALIILVITFAILATQFYWGVRKKKVLGAIIPLVMTALFITISFLEKTSRVRYHWNYLCSSNYYRVVHRIF